MSPDATYRRDLANMAQLFAYHHRCAYNGSGIVCRRCRDLARETITALHRDRHPSGQPA